MQYKKVRTNAQSMRTYSAINRNVYFISPFPLRALSRAHSVYAIPLKTNMMKYVFNLKIITLVYPGTDAGLPEASLLWSSVVHNNKQANKYQMFRVRFINGKETFHRYIVYRYIINNNTILVDTDTVRRYSLFKIFFWLNY